MLALLMLLAGCARQPDDAVVRNALQAELDGALGAGVLNVESLRRAGSTRAPAATDDRQARLVYFNARLRLTRDYDFSRWESHSVGTLRSLLGAGPRGVQGVKADGNRAGDELTAFGTLGFEKRGDDWVVIATEARVARAPSGQPEPGLGPVPGAPRGRVDADPPGAVDTALRQWHALAGTPPAPTLPAEERDRILVEELDRAHLAAQQRMQRVSSEFVLAGGPEGGAYEEVARALEKRGRAMGMPLLVRPSVGSAANVRLLATGTVQFAIVQNDVALAAYQGRGRFAGAPQTGLRSLASLFPEPVHLIASARSGIRRVEDLRGKRVGIGAAESGTRVNALAILAAAGVAVDALAIANDDALPAAAAALAAGEIDALFATTHAPASEIARLATRVALAWIEIPPSATPRDLGLIPFTLPARTYPGQNTAVTTVASTALMLVREDLPDAAAQAMLGLLFDAADAQRAQSAVLAQIDKRTARMGVTLPWLPVADRALPAVAAER
ncbi:MAG TPA: TAXI family TRAP transporter solute-binding subunit [Burkholderiaceae bacterium]|nr:TAXI family TRAP transporter solute-binding subunit [Burkholderiaceae bacterium]